ncbi:hypothetical protein BU17DRAFT_77649 [Hysterangium stoloniferum]|nr:hypothetical protein BU17DRAFT_77649 [Hysterangium stoloniferum]
MDDGLTEEKINKTDTECGKYYNKYKKACLIGALMVLWCHHLICLGFHIIPTAEGLNDVFPVIYTHWPIAPKIIVYDFACQPASYCLIHKPSFFCNAQFVIDEFHTADHTKCSKAINTSVAEIGNSGAAKIHKSVSYMTQCYAIQYVKVYMETNYQMWNKGRIRKIW